MSAFVSVTPDASSAVACDSTPTSRSRGALLATGEDEATVFPEVEEPVEAPKPAEEPKREPRTRPRPFPLPGATMQPPPDPAKG